ncbi:hypothetical protein BN7_3030 [Wickerhamomyces ciferrii]|uniref:Uncharacterized protein n=1 Tax=Wickerhamomyces ciferrii (strain ATCC 14091 / BCRC 22168 / CBS 111 / JCM 3599 / NBRC 0793 / NRRL Y-1031 F-60-10) TaxID=1206466 RepID=K0KEC3_WICCF|nr:uncharacterized protein BN7_3030 [Wickerhamomyces ciferrii]CCH43480.1 hypothetical protein BN7_3030 [Wickerhamomyces ciferrii]
MSIESRINQLEFQIDTQQNIPSQVNKLNNYINQFIKSQPSITKLFQFLNNSNIHFYYNQEFQNINELDVKRQFINSNLQQITNHVENLLILQNMEKKQLEFGIINKSKQIENHFERLRELEFKYNQLILRSINLLQNFLKLNENIKRCSMKLQRS